MAKSFEAQIRDWAGRTTEAVEAVFKQSAQDVFSEAQTPVAAGGNMPVDTNFLRRSFVSALNGQGGTRGPEAYVFTISGAKLGDTVFGGWTADYTVHVHYGARGRPGRLWVDKAAANWQNIVARNAARARGL